MACCEAEAEGQQNEEGRRTAGSSVRMPQPCRLPRAGSRLTQPGTSPPASGSCALAARA